MQFVAAITNDALSMQLSRKKRWQNIRGLEDCNIEEAGCGVWGLGS